MEIEIEASMMIENWLPAAHSKLGIETSPTLPIFPLPAWPQWCCGTEARRRRARQGTVGWQRPRAVSASGVCSFHAWPGDRPPVLDPARG